jgi:hypothetical protein
VVHTHKNSSAIVDGSVLPVVSYVTPEVIERNQKTDDGIGTEESVDTMYPIYGVLGVALVAMFVQQRFRAGALSSSSDAAEPFERTPTPTAASAPTSPFSSQEPLDRTPSYHEAILDPDITVCHL